MSEPAAKCHRLRWSYLPKWRDADRSSAYAPVSIYLFKRKIVGNLFGMSSLRLKYEARACALSLPRVWLARQLLRLNYCSLIKFCEFSFISLAA